MLRAIFWKEWRQQRLFLFAILILMPIVLGVFAWVSGIFADGVGGPIAEKLGSICWLVACFQAIVTGSVLFAGESETGTLDFLDVCSAERSRIWFAKMASALAITLPVMLLPTFFVGVRRDCCSRSSRWTHCFSPRRLPSSFGRRTCAIGARGRFADSWPSASRCDSA